MLQKLYQALGTFSYSQDLSETNRDHRIDSYPGLGTSPSKSIKASRDHPDRRNHCKVNLLRVNNDLSTRDLSQAQASGLTVGDSYSTNLRDNLELTGVNSEPEEFITDEEKIWLFTGEQIEEGDLILTISGPSEPNIESDQQDSSTVFGMYKRVDQRIRPVSTAFPQSASVTRTLP